MRFVQDHLQANVDTESSLKYLKRTYDKYLRGVAETNGDEGSLVESEYRILCNFCCSSVASVKYLAPCAARG